MPADPAASRSKPGQESPVSRGPLRYSRNIDASTRARGSRATLATRLPGSYSEVSGCGALAATLNASHKTRCLDATYGGHCNG
jgi:hypothetical protein